MPRKVEIYTNGSCIYCVAAKNLLAQKGLGYQEVRVDADPARLAELLARTRARSFPQIFVDGEYIGGYDELAAAERAGRLSGEKEDAA